MCTHAVSCFLFHFDRVVLSLSWASAFYRFWKFTYQTRALYEGYGQVSNDSNLDNNACCDSVFVDANYPNTSVVTDITTNVLTQSTCSGWKSGCRLMYTCTLYNFEQIARVSLHMWTLSCGVNFNASRYHHNCIRLVLISMQPQTDSIHIIFMSPQIHSSNKKW